MCFLYGALPEPNAPEMMVVLCVLSMIFSVIHHTPHSKSVDQGYQLFQPNLSCYQPSPEIKTLDLSGNDQAQSLHQTLPGNKPWPHLTALDLSCCNSECHLLEAALL